MGDDGGIGVVEDLSHRKIWTVDDAVRTGKTSSQRIFVVLHH